MCFFCKIALPEGKIHFRDACPNCGHDIHICKNCRFYKPGAYRDCAETVPEEVTDKEKMNFCEYFVPVTDAGNAGDAHGNQKSARDAFSDLFK